MSIKNFGLFLFTITSLQVSANSEINSDFQTAVELGFTHNSFNRQSFIQKPNYITIYTVDLPIDTIKDDQLLLQRSTQLSLQEQNDLLSNNKVFLSNADKKIVRIYIPQNLQNFDELAQAIQFNFGKSLLPTAVGSLLPTSNGTTYVVYTTDQPHLPPFYIKTFGFLQDTPQSNSHWFGEVATKNNMAINDIMRSMLGQDATKLFIQESAIVNLKLKTKFNALVGYSFLARDFAPVGMSLENQRTYSLLSGFLGRDLHGNYSPLLIEAAKTNNHSEKKWVLKIFIPYFAKWLAELNYKKGIYPASHAANLYIAINPKTGKISNMSFKDLADVSIDPLFLLSKKKFHLLNEAKKAGLFILGSKASKKLLSIPNLKTTDTGDVSIISSHIDNHFIQFTSQILFTHKEFSEFDYFNKFVKIYISEVNRIIGIKHTVPIDKKWQAEKMRVNAFVSQISDTEVQEVSMTILIKSLQALALFSRYGLITFREEYFNIPTFPSKEQRHWKSLSSYFKNYLLWLGPRVIVGGISKCLACTSIGLTMELRKTQYLTKRIQHNYGFYSADYILTNELPAMDVMGRVYSAVQNKILKNRCIKILSFKAILPHYFK